MIRQMGAGAAADNGVGGEDAAEHVLYESGAECAGGLCGEE